MQKLQEKKFLILLLPHPHLRHIQYTKGVVSTWFDIKLCVSSMHDMLKIHWAPQNTVFLINVKTKANSINWERFMLGTKGWRKPPRSLKCKVISQFTCKMTQIIITFSHAKFAASKPTSNGEKKNPPFFLQSLSQWNRSLLKTALCNISLLL